MQLLTETHLKQLSATMSKDTLRGALCGIRVAEDQTNKGALRFDATDGHTGVCLKNIDPKFVNVLVPIEYGVSLPISELLEGSEVILYAEHNTRKKLKKPLLCSDEVYPNIDRCVPSEFACDTSELPFFGYAVNVQAKKILGNKTGYFPDKWGSRKTLTLCYLDDERESFFFAMPLNPPKEWVKAHSGWDSL